VQHAWESAASEEEAALSYSIAKLALEPSSQTSRKGDALRTLRAIC